MGKHLEFEARYGMVINLDRCLGCGSCVMACATESNVGLTPEGTDFRRGITWMRVERSDNGGSFAEVETVRIPVPCQQCDDPPCLHVCPVTAIETDFRSGIVTQIPARCMGCRYCMAACPYHTRYFNWWDPTYPSEEALNPDVSPRMRGVAEKCNFCHGRLQRAREEAAAAGKDKHEAVEYTPACVEACPSGALVFGNLMDEKSPVAQLSRSSNAFRLLPTLGTSPKVFYYSERAWVRELGDNPRTVKGEEVGHG